jgi:putative oxidoreductase
MLKKILFGGEYGLSPLTNAGLTILRVFAGLSLMLGHGIAKLPPSAGMIENTSKMGFPAPTLFSWAAAMSEFLGGAFLAIGLFTRLSSLFIILTMLTALYHVHFADPYAKQELAFVYFFIALAYLLKGAGDWSADALLRKLVRLLVFITCFVLIRVVSWFRWPKSTCLQRQ